jgi:glycosyltransferase involved in cell wall biosynthesis
MIENPRVSILLPVYNSELYIREAVESILAQTFSNLELIIINDGSTDRSVEILDEYQTVDDRIRLYQHPQNQGLIATLNHGLQLVRGEYLAQMHADDISLPERIMRQVHALDADPDLVIVGSAYELITQQGEFIRVDRLPVPDTSIRWHLLFHSSFAHPSVMMRIDVLRRNNLTYNPQMILAEDYDLWSRLIGYGKGTNIDFPLIKYRQHPTQGSKLNPTELSNNADKISQQNLDGLGITLSIEDVKILRNWYYRFPSRLHDADIHSCRSLLRILSAFCLQPGLDSKITSQIRSRTVLKMTKAVPPGLWRDFWSMGLLRIIQPKDILMMFSLAVRHVIRSPKG